MLIVGYILIKYFINSCKDNKCIYIFSVIIE